MGKLLIPKKMFNLNINADITEQKSNQFESLSRKSKIDTSITTHVIWNLVCELQRELLSRRRQKESTIKRAQLREAINNCGAIKVHARSPSQEAKI